MTPPPTPKPNAPASPARAAQPSQSFATDDLRIVKQRPLLPPAVLLEELPVGDAAAELVARARREAGAIVRGDDDRLLVVMGPCSIHDPKAAVEYGARFAELAARLADELLLVMRVYFEKPRTRVGWKGFINDPDRDESFAINKGLRLARQLLVDLAGLGVAVGSEFLDTISPQFIADLVSWGAIGARTAESQVHRELASGLSMPVGFKNGTAGSVQLAIDAASAARRPHHFLSVTKQGLAAIAQTLGNEDTHVILRGGASGPNFGPDHVAAAAAALEAAGLPPRVMVDLSHGNSAKDPEKQRDGAASIAAQVRGGSGAVLGVMIESHLVGGRQDAKPGAPLVFGQSITDACLGWEPSVALVEGLAVAVRRARASKPPASKRATAARAGGGDGA